MRTRVMNLLLLASLSGLLTGVGGCLYGLPANIWEGFGEGLGAIPANIVAQAIATALGITIAA